MITIIEKFKINKMKKEQLEEYLVFNFDRLSPKLQEFAILKYGNFILHEHDIKHYKITVQNIESGFDINGICYSKNTNDLKYSEKIVINKRHIEYEDIVNILKTMHHECKHAFQNNFLEVSKDENICLNEYAKKLDYCKNKTNIDIKFCNFHLKNTSLHLRKNNITEDFNIKSDIFYHLNISEREAFLEEEKFSFFCFKKYHIADNNSQDMLYYISEFNKVYHCNLNQQEIFDVIDTCYENLVEGNLPSHTEYGNLVATVMYDMCLVSGYNSGLLNREEVINLSKLQEKQQILAKEDYLVYGTNYDGNLFSLEQQNKIIKNPELLGNLTKTEQNTNTFIIWKVISYNQDKDAKYFNNLLKDKDTFFKQIVEDDSSREICSEYLTKIFGDDFTKYLNQKEFER